MELIFTSQQFYDQRCSLVDVIRDLEREGCPLEICPPLLEGLLLLKFPEYRKNIQRRFEFYGKRSDTILEYIGDLIDIERFFYDVLQGRASASRN